MRSITSPSRVMAIEMLHLQVVPSVDMANARHFIVVKSSLSCTLFDRIPDIVEAKFFSHNMVSYYIYKNKVIT